MNELIDIISRDWLLIAPIAGSFVILGSWRVIWDFLRHGRSGIYASKSCIYTRLLVRQESEYILAEGYNLNPIRIVKWGTFGEVSQEFRRVLKGSYARSTPGLKHILLIIEIPDQAPGHGKYVAKSVLDNGSDMYDVFFTSFDVKRVGIVKASLLRKSEFIYSVKDLPDWLLTWHLRRYIPLLTAAEYAVYALFIVGIAYLVARFVLA